jgi:predicted aconitase
MKLTKEERLMLDGQEGEGVRKAIEILNALGEIYGAEKMITIKSAQISGVSYNNLGDAGLAFLDDWAKEGAYVRVPTTLNPAGMDLLDWKKLGFGEDFAEKQLSVVDAYERMGVSISCTCTPYLVGNLPQFGEHIAWSESSAVSYANSVLGARTNREGGPSALAAAICGRTPEYGLHLDENRRSDLIVDVRCDLSSASDFGALGNIVGKKVGNRIPFFTGIKAASLDELKSLGASMAASGAVALYHVKDITPEAKRMKMVSDAAEKIVIDDISPGYEALNSGSDEIDLVAIGCPHASLAEIDEVARLLSGKKVKAELWVTTSSAVKEVARENGLLKKIETAGGHIVADTCMIVAPIGQLGFRHMATNAAKAAFYAPSHCKTTVRFGTLKHCIEAAVSGVW